MWRLTKKGPAPTRSTNEDAGAINVGHRVRHLHDAVQFRHLDA